MAEAMLQSWPTRSNPSVERTVSGVLQPVSSDGLMAAAELQRGVSPDSVRHKDYLRRQTHAKD
jgi:hypothetical protein